MKVSDKFSKKFTESEKERSGPDLFTLKTEDITHTSDEISNPVK